MSKLLAPNGKPSNLNPEQYKLVRSSAFKKWFGDWEKDPANASKIVDENGEPLPVYHGSQSSFTTFDISLSGKSNDKASVGFWFTPIKSFANNFAESVWYGNKNLTTYEVFLSIKNPKIYVKGVDDLDKIKDLSKKLVLLENEVDYIMNEKWRDDYKDYQVLMYAIQGVINTSNMADYLRTKNSVEVIKDGIKYNEIQIEIYKIRDEINDLRYSDSYEKFRTDIHKIEGGNSERANTGGLGMTLKNGKKTILEYKQSLINKYFDGIIIEQTRFDSMEAGGVNTQFVAFESNQIKFADGTNTNFDSNNPDIRYAKGGQVYSKEYINKRIEWVLKKRYRNLDEEEYSEIENNLYNFSNQDFPVGLYNLPKKIKLYRILYLKSEKDFNKDELGVHFIADTRLINDDFLWSIGITKKEYKKLYLVTINVDSEYIDIDWTLSYKARYPNEFEFTLKDNSKYEVESIEKYNPDIRFEDGGEVNTGLFSQIWEWFGIKF